MKRILYTGSLTVFIFLYTGTLAQPSISSFTPASGPAGTTVTITGSNFSTTASDNIVYFGTMRASIVTATSTSLTVVAPYGTIHQPITVTTGNYTAYSKMPFLSTFQGIGSAFMPHSFVSALNKPTGLYPNCVAVGDIDQDGRPDLVVANWTSGTISLFRNTGSKNVIAFDGKVDFATQAGPESVTLGDLDGDGKLDLAVANFDANSISVFKNNSTPGSFALSARTDYVAGTHPMSVCIDDLNLDGRPDIAVANQQANSVSIYVNTTASGTISFNPKTDLAADAPSSLTTGDVDGDGKPELITTSFSYYPFSVYRNISSAGSISFAPKAEFWSNASPLGSCLADLDADGRLDVAVANYNANTVTFFRNQSNTSGFISFNPKVEHNIGGGTHKVAAADLDGDGKADIAAVNQTTNSFTAFNNSSVFNPASNNWENFNTGSGPNWIAISDLDSNGRPEIIVVNSNDNNLTIFKNAVGEARVQPSGSNPVTGVINNKMTLDASVQTYNGSPYVQRHYDIEPVNNPATATATVTLYFTQQDFDNFNVFPGHGPDLPHNPTDVANKANLRVYQYHGFSTSSLPGTYSGPAQEINPDDNKIVWNYTTLLWEVSFDVTGFSGFFVSGPANSILPLTLLSFTASAQDKIAGIQWITAQEMDVDHFELRRSVDGRNFSALALVKAKGTAGSGNTYRYNDTLHSPQAYYYQLKMVDKDGSFKLSHVVKINARANTSFVSLYPNPAKKYLIISHPSSEQTSEVKLLDMHGRVIKKQTISAGISETRMNLAGLPPANYYVVWSNGANMKGTILIVE